MKKELRWQRVISRSDARDLQQFTCTTDFPKTPGGRRLPHTRPWEWEAQRHLRQLSQIFKRGDVALLARTGEGVVGAVHLQFSAGGGVLEAFHASVAVAQTVRHQGGHVADELLRRARAEAMEHASELGCPNIVLSGKIHVSNAASQRLVERAGWEPRMFRTPTTSSGLSF